MSELRLLQLFPSTIRGGAEEYALSICTAAAEKGWDVHVAFPLRNTTDNLRHDFTAIGACCHTLEIPAEEKNAKHFLLHFARTLRLLLLLKPDVVHLTLPLPDQGIASMAACALIKVPTIVVFQLVVEGCPVSRNLARVCEWSQRRNQQWISISENNRDLLSKLFTVSRSDIAVIYNSPIFCKDVDAHTLKTDIARVIKKEIGLSESDKIVLTVGRLSYQKGYSFVIPALPYFRRKYPDTWFVWVGEGEQKGELESLINEYGVDDRVVFLGYRKDIPRLLRASDVFLFPTLFEGGSSIALVEAMLFGLPIVASMASGIPEVIDNNVHGILFRKADSCALLTALDWALENPEEMEKMARNASTRVNNFSIEIMTGETLGLIEKLAQPA